jgi:hypothetical protein
MLSLGLPPIEIMFSSPQKANSFGGKSSESPTFFKTATGETVKVCKSTGKVICTATGKVLKKTAIVWPIKIVLGILDILATPFGKMTGKDLNFNKLWKVGVGMILLSFWIYVLMDSNAAHLFREIGVSEFASIQLALISKTLFPGGLALMGVCMVVGGMRLQMGRTFMQKYGMGLEPLPAFESGVIFRIGDLKLSLRDTHTGIGAFGGIGSGKTVSLMVPMMRQFFRQLRDADDNSEYAKCGALILDEKGDFIDSTITEMLLAGRSLQDLVIIDPDLDLYRYNPLDPNQTADENAAKLAKVQKILGTTSGGDNAYWDQTSQMTIKYFLQLLEVYKPKHKIGLDDIARFMRDDSLATVLCDKVEGIIEEKKANNEISEEAYGSYTDAVSSTRNAWIKLNPNTKSTLKTTITNMLGPIASTPRLQKVFCRDTNFSFKDLPNKGKVVLFRGSGIDKSTARLICVCLKIDFQTWQKRRNGSAATAFGLNTSRTVMFMCDEYQEFVTCGGEGDETFYGVSRSTRTAPVVATQSYNSLETAIKNKEQTKTLRQNIATWVFFRSTDQETCELGKFLAGQSKKEDFSTSQDTTGLLETASNLAGGTGGKGSSISISKKLEENFRTDDFSRLITMTMEKSKTGPWYSEAIVYHYHDIDEEAESRCYKTRLPHLYYDNKLRKQAALNVKHLDHILYDRTWQRKAMQRGLLLVQRSLADFQGFKSKEDGKSETESEVKKAEDRSRQSPEEVRRKQRVANLIDSTKQETNRDKESYKNGAQGAIQEDDDTTEEELNNHVQHLEDLLLQTSDEDEARRIRVEIDCTKQRMTRFVLTAASRQSDTKKEVLRADKYLHEVEEEDEAPEPHDGELERLAETAEASGESGNSAALKRSNLLEDIDDELWEIEIPDTEEDLPHMNIPLHTISGSQMEDDEDDVFEIDNQQEQEAMRNLINKETSEDLDSFSDDEFTAEVIPEKANVKEEADNDNFNQNNSELQELQEVDQVDENSQIKELGPDEDNNEENSLISGVINDISWPTLDTENPDNDPLGDWSDDDDQNSDK